MYCINPNDDEPIMWLGSQIGKGEEGEAFIDGDLFAQELMYMDGEGKKCINIYINSPGGSVIGGMAIYGAMLKTKTPVNTYNIGIAYSIAAVIFQAGKKRIMLDYSTLMYHNAYVPDGSKNKGLDMLNDSIAKMVSGRSWRDLEAVKVMMDKTTFISADEALASDLCDKVEEASNFNTKKAKNEAMSDYRALLGDTFMNKVILPNYKNKHQNQMNKDAICALLGLDPAKTTETEALNAIAALNASKVTPVNSDAIAALELKNKELAEKIKAKEEAEALALKTKEEADAKEKAKNAILAKAKERSLTLTDEVVNNYVTMAGNTEDGLKLVINTIEAIPVLKKSPDFRAHQAANSQNTVAFVTDEKGGVVDTSAMISQVNRMAMEKAKNRFNPENN